ncbi:MAG: hypothetical protein D6770_08670 [Anaerolineae bacterium]|nr:MAG: hypothetical protein D6770_08670 [Anaerolineae bacterium]
MLHTQIASRIRVILFILLVLAVLAGLAWANTALARRYPLGGGEFLATWSAARALVEGGDPYSKDVAHQTQTLTYGRAAREGEYPYYPNLPLPLLLLFLPFALTDDPVLARGLWLSLSELALLALAFAAPLLAEWRPRRLSLTVFLFLALLWAYALIPLVGGFLTILHAALITAALLALREEQDELAGALLALVTFYWEIGGLLMLFVALWLRSHRRGRPFVTFAMTLATLSGIAFVIRPSWLLPFLRAVIADRRAAIGMTLRLPLVYWWPEGGRPLAAILSSLLAIVLLLEWRAARRQGFRHFYWVTCLTIALPPLLGIRTAAHHYPLLILPIALTLATIEDRWERLGKWLAALLMLFLLGGTWALFRSFTHSIAPEAEIALLFIPPLLATLGLYWSRWWILRPPRTWLDRVKRFIQERV